eukprot:TRINITY_DN2541_c0_g1_i1.p1 TRINITY_DN2541_c0_g1~~TRINITY_DN2541_c0_g1_i1.p1  ORF type:complete len:113 (-),score=20.32 TRINITY_DN2541_c0_g1_i1:318-656(-)
MNNANDDAATNKEQDNTNDLKNKQREEKMMMWNSGNNNNIKQVMKNAEFVALLMANAHKTSHVGIYCGSWISGARRTPFSILKNAGRIVTCIQKLIDEGKLCDKKNRRINDL